MCLFFFFFIELYLLYNLESVSTIQQNWTSYMCTYVPSFLNLFSTWSVPRSFMIHNIIVSVVSPLLFEQLFEFFDFFPGIFQWFFFPVNQNNILYSSGLFIYLRSIYKDSIHLVSSEGHWIIFGVSLMGSYIYYSQTP